MATDSVIGINPKQVYTVTEFLKITGISRDRLSKMRRKGLVVRDAGVPTILGADWVEFCKNAPVAQSKPRGVPFKSGSEHPRSKQKPKAAS